MTRGCRIVLSIGLVLSVVASLLSVVQPRVLQNLVNGIAAGRSTLRAATLLTLLALGTAAVQGLQGYLVQRGAESIARGMRDRLVSRYLSRTVAAHDRANSADLLSRASVDVNVVKNMVSAGLIPIVGAIVMLVGISGFMILLDPILFLTILVAFLIGLAIVVSKGRSVRKMSLDLQTSLGSFAASVERLLAGIRTVKASGAEDSEREKVGVQSVHVWTEGVRLARLVSLIQPLVNLCLQGALLVVVILGAMRLSSGRMDVGELLAFLVYLFMLITPISTLSQSYAQLQMGFGALDRIMEVDGLDEEDFGLDASTGRRRGVSIEFSGVDFGYLEGEPVLRDCSFAIRPGEKVAIVGRSGSGKSTIVELIERFYEADRGEIFVGGRNVSSMPVSELRSHIALVSQETETLTGTVRDNLAPGTHAVSDDRMRTVLRQVGLCGPDGRLDLDLDTDLGQGGISLSGGQRQRLAWARLLLGDADILLLDEATSHLDPQTEAAIFALLNAHARGRHARGRHARGRTVVMVTHSETAAAIADRVLLISGGGVRKEGTHRQLLRESVEYRQLRAESRRSEESPISLEIA
ncbi:ABC transporter, ATP-binding protein [Actinobaculum sp. oral taxon 183 str. F0552]|uniref:ABC transporter ATP-binding protein n=1 Tax=Actinobaculum sp. oral taxon 183 TaxID=712888 RepID=UPI000397E628|nr:ABC transporter ATP-binding protein [Actinobaculum sp. oral taxon 183]ERH14265.1 ABC transporter, ATP-binding protein [Actinobaculum sp. oral taxon 183 str. F0552]